MSQYLSSIVARNTAGDSNGLLHTLPLFNAMDAGIGKDFIEGNGTQENSIENQPVQLGIVSDQPLMPQKTQQPAVLNETQKAVTKKNTETSYFLKHLERITAEKESTPVKNKTVETVSFGMNEAASQGVLKNIGDNQNVPETGFVNKTILKIGPEKKITKKQTSEKENKKTAATNLNEPVEANEVIFSEKQIIQPADKIAEVQDKKLDLSDNLGIERVIPNQPEQLINKPMQNSKEHQTAPKLVIGKITVEILPAKLPIPQKIITNIVQSPSKDSYSKSNRLIFGLGQL